MTQVNSLLTQVDSVTERKRILAKVYRLLISLAEAEENKSNLINTAAVVEGKTKEPSSLNDETAS